MHNMHMCHLYLMQMASQFLVYFITYPIALIGDVESQEDVPVSNVSKVFMASVDCVSLNYLILLLIC